MKPTVLLGFLLPWVWSISSKLLQQSTAAAPDLGHGVVPLGHHPDLGHGVAPLGHSCSIAAAAPLFEYLFSILWVIHLLVNC